MKRIGLFLLLSGAVVVVARPSAMIPDQVRIDTGALAGVAGCHAADRSRVQGHPVCGAAARGEPVAGATAGGEVGWRAQADAFGAPCAAGAPFGGRGGGGARGARARLPDRPRPAAPAAPAS